MDGGHFLELSGQKTERRTKKKSAFKCPECAVPQFLNLSKEQRNESFPKHPVSEARFYRSQRVPLRKNEKQRAKKQDTRLRPAESRKKGMFPKLLSSAYCFPLPWGICISPCAFQSSPSFFLSFFCCLSTLSSSSPLGKNKSETQNNS